MRAEQRGQNLIVYEREERDKVQEAIERLARLSAAELEDGDACAVSVLFDRWQAGAAYQKGQRIADEAGRLYRVEQDHVSQPDWPVDGTPALYTPLGVDSSRPEAVPEWRQPTGAQDAYQKGDRVRYEGAVYVSQADGNVWAPGTGDLWRLEADSTEGR